MAKFVVRVGLGALVMLAVVSARAFADPVVDGFWTPANTDGYNLYSFQYTDLGNMSCSSGTPDPMDPMAAMAADTGCVDTGTLGLYVDTTDPNNEKLFLMLAQPVGVNDNSFGTSAIGWGSTGHSLMDLLGSDHMELTINDPNGEGTLWFGGIDYASDLTNIAGGGMGDMVGATADTIGSAGYGGDGFTPTGTSTQNGGKGASALIAAQSSLGWDLGQAAGQDDLPSACRSAVIGTSGSNGGNTPVPVNPATETQDLTQATCASATTNWLYTNAYEVELNLNDLGLQGDTTDQIASLLDIVVHNSPSKGVVNLCTTADCTTTVPEPESLALLGSGILAVGALLRRRQRLLH